MEVSNQRESRITHSIPGKMVFCVSGHRDLFLFVYSWGDSPVNKQSDLSLIPRTHIFKKPGMVTHTDLTISGEAETGVSLELTVQPALPTWLASDQ